MNILNAIIDNLFLFKDVGNYVPTIIQIVVIFIWVILTRKSSKRYQISLIVSLLLLLVSIVAMVLTFKSVAYMVGVYAFIFLGIGMVQSIFTD